MPLKFNIFKNRSAPSKDQSHVQSRSYNPSWSPEKRGDHDTLIGTGTRRARAMARIQTAFNRRSHDGKDSKLVQQKTRPDSRHAGSPAGQATPKRSSAASDFSGVSSTRTRARSATPRRLENVPGSYDWWAKVMEERDAPMRERTMSDPEFSFKMMRTSPCEADIHAEAEPPLPSIGLADGSAEAETCADSSSRHSDYDDCDDISEGPCPPEEVVVVANATDIPEQEGPDFPRIIQGAQGVVTSTEPSQAVSDVFHCANGLETPARVSRVEEVDFLDPQPSQAAVVNDTELFPESPQFAPRSLPARLVESVAQDNVPPEKSLSRSLSGSVLVGHLGRQDPRKDLQILSGLSIVQQRRAKHQDGRR